jgi:hypothetical protein
MEYQIPQRRVLFPRCKKLVGLLVLGVFLLTAILTTVAPKTVNATASSNLNFQARLMTASGGIVPDGNYNVEFKIYNTATVTATPDQGACTRNGGTAEPACLWTETRTSGNVVQVKNGYLTVNLGSVTSFPTTIPWGQPLFLTMRIGGVGTPSWDPEMNPRLALTAVPYAFQAGQLVNNAGSFSSSLSINTPTVGNQIFQIPDQAASGTFTLLTTTAANTAYIQNTSSPQSSSNFNISGNGTIGGNASVTGTYNSNTFNSNTLTFGAAGTATIQSAASQALNITGNAASTFSTSAGNLTLQAGSGTVSLGSSTALTNTGALTVTGGTTLSLTSTSTNAASFDSGTTGGVNVGTNGNAKIVTIGNSTGATGVVVNTGTNGLSLGNNAVNKTINIGATAATANTTTTNIDTSTGAIQTTNIGGTNASGGSNAGSVVNLQGGAIGFGISNSSALLKSFTNSATAFQVQPAGSTTPTFDVDTSTGRVGIGTNGPGATLDIVGSLAADAINTRITNNAASGFSELTMRTDAGTYTLGTGGSTSIAPNIFYLQDAIAGAARLLVDSTGKVAIGSSAPSYKLDVQSGDINTSGVYRVGGTSGATTTCSGGQFLQNQVVVGGITTGGTCAAGGGGSGATTIGTIGTTSLTNGGTIVGTTLTFGIADASGPGMVTNAAQTIAGAKTFSGGVIGDGSGLTNLNATNLNSGTVNAARVAGSYTGITGTGALAAGSIASGFGTISTTNNITTTTTIQGATLNATTEVDTAGVTRLDNSGNLVNIGNITASGTYNSNTFSSSTLTFGAASTATIQSATSQALNITGKAASTFSTTAGNLTIQAGSGTVSLGSSTSLINTGALAITAGSTLTLSSTGANNASFDSGTTGGVNIGTGANAKAITIGNGTVASAVNILGNSAGIEIGNNAANKTIDVGVTGSTANTTAVNVATSTGAAQTIKLGGTFASGGSNASSTVSMQGGATGMQVTNSGATIKTFTNSATAFQVQDSTGVTQLAFDTTNDTLYSANYDSFPGTGGGSTPTTPTFVQSAGTSSTGTLVNIAAPSMPSTAINNLLVASVTWSSFGPITLTGCSDSLGNTYAVAAQAIDTAQTQGVAVCYAVNTHGPGAAVITATFSATTTFRGISVAEYSGVATTSPVDVTASNFGAVTGGVANGATSTTATTTVNGDLIVGGFGVTQNGGTMSAGTGAITFTIRNNQSTVSVNTEDGLQATAGSVAATETDSSTGRYAGVMVAFKAGAIITPASSILTIGGVNATKVQIGSGTADSNPVLFVVDSYNLSDPTGVNGAMYYSTVYNAFRCYENGAWYSCLSHHVIPLTADVASTASTSFQDITGLSFAAASGTSYRFHTSLIYTASASSIGLRASLTGPTASLLAYSTITGPGGTSGGACGSTTCAFTNFQDTYDAGSTSTASIGSSAGSLLIMDGVLTASASGTVTMRFAPETLTASGIVIKAGSTLEWW